MQVLTEGHETALRTPEPGVGVTVQLLPSQRSASGADGLDCPTATQNVPVGHETPASWPPAIFGIACRAQLLPSHRAARVALTLRLLV